MENAGAHCAGRTPRHVGLVRCKCRRTAACRAVDAVRRRGGVAEHRRATGLRCRHRLGGGAEPCGYPSVAMVLCRIGNGRRRGKRGTAPRAELPVGAAVPGGNRSLSGRGLSARNEDGGDLVPRPPWPRHRRRRWRAHNRQGGAISRARHSGRRSAASHPECDRRRTAGRRAHRCCLPRWAGALSATTVLAHPRWRGSA